MKGGKDPFNRGYFQWGNIDEKLQNYYKKMCGLRREFEELRNGNIRFEGCSNVLVFYRDNLKIAINMSDEPYEFNEEYVFGENITENTINKYGFVLTKKGRSG